jgi:very-short-patch-repair endonuclease
MGEGDRKVTALARKQNGVFTRAQVLAAGMSRNAISWRLDHGDWELAYKGIYRLPAFPNSWEQRLRVALYALGDGGAVSHRSAAALWRIDGFASGEVELSTSGRTVPLLDHVIVHERRALAPVDVANVAGFRVTTLTRTVVDLASVVGEERLEGALEHALNRRTVTLPGLRECIERVGPRRGLVSLRSLLDARDPALLPSESEAETKLFRLLRHGGLPPPRRQICVWDNGAFLGRVDLGWEALKVFVEADSLWHLGLKRVSRDHARRNDLVAAGWRPLTVMWKDMVRTPRKVIVTVRRTLQRALSDQSRDQVVSPCVSAAEARHASCSPRVAKRPIEIRS